MSGSDHPRSSRQIIGGPLHDMNNAGVVFMLSRSLASIACIWMDGRLRLRTAGFVSPCRSI